MDSNSSIKAYDDPAFIRQEECRGIRLQLEYLKPELTFSAHDVRSTIVVFGSARIKSPDDAAAVLAAARQALVAAPHSEVCIQRVHRAELDFKCSKYYDIAREFSRLVTRKCQSVSNELGKQFVVLTGGGPGIMEAGNRGAADAGGASAALSIELPHEQSTNEYVTPELSFNLSYFNIRKMHFLKRALGLACFPGGYGTMDELFEALTLVQTKKIKRIPILLFGRDFWEKLINWDVFVEMGLISPEDLSLFKYCDTAEEGWDALCDFYEQLKTY